MNRKIEKRQSGTKSMNNASILKSAKEIGKKDCSFGASKF